MKKIIITGAAGNLGKACVKEFINSGHYVIAADAVIKKEDFGALNNLEVHALDASNETAAKTFVENILSQHKQIDAALLLIGGFAMGNIENSDAAEIQKMILLNFNTAYFTARPVFNQMTKQAEGGKLIFMASDPALDDKKGFDMIGYTLSKAMLVKLAKILNSEGQKKNISSVVVAPTTIDTPQNRTAMPNADFSKWTKPEEIAAVLEFICSEKGNKLKDLVIRF
ncbi:MAG: SDR family NAD(P)-dependent oxidoreductase [Bacteroidia bacterium]